MGLYRDAVAANKKAYDFDVTRSGLCVNPYLPEHNVNLLIYAARCGATHSRRMPSRAQLGSCLVRCLHLNVFRGWGGWELELILRAVPPLGTQYGGPDARC